MKNLFAKGDTKTFKRVVLPSDQAIFHGALLHPVCATFALARDFEWTSRLFFLEMKEEDEEGVGTHVSVDHKSPAYVGEEIIFTARIAEIKGMELICDIEARVDQRIVATGSTGQKMLKKEKLNRLWSRPEQA